MQHNPSFIENRINEIPLDMRISGLNKTAELKSKVFGLNNEALKFFMLEMRDRFSQHHEENKKFLGVILYMAGIEKERHDCKFEDLTTTEIFNIVKAINHIKAVTSLLPKNLALPLN